MRVLFLTPQPPFPPHQGAALRNYNLIKNMARWHEVHLLSFGSPEADLGELRAYCASIEVVTPPARTGRQRLATLLLSRQADMAMRLESPPFRAGLRSLLAERQFAIMQAEGIEMAQYLALAAAGAGPDLVFDDHNAEYVLQRRAWETDRRNPRRWLGAVHSLAQWQRLTTYERQVCRLADGLVAVSEADRQALSQLDKRLQVAVVPNGIDPEYFRPNAARNQASCPPQLVFTGTLDFRPNVDAVVWFVQQVLPLIAREEPAVRFFVVGQRPHSRVLALASANVVVTGPVPDIRPYLADSAVYVVPLRIGGGTRFKVLEAMAAGIPVVSTTLGAEGIAVSDGVEVALADSPAEFASRVLAALRGPAQAQEMARRARGRVVAAYDWQVLVPQLNELYERIEAQRRQRRS